jgi:hypothetical protein
MCARRRIGRAASITALVGLGIVIVIVIVIGTARLSLAEDPPGGITHGFLATGGQTYLRDGEGKITWRYPVTPDKKLAWVHRGAMMPGIHHFQILDTNGKATEGRPLR